ncbi:hypothetical protein [Streptomyces collinus]|uniref:hypothetical protein n=1 Tax=Streptomyces collinus TaxID=42684 RepID=UPI00367828D1
MSGCTSVTWTPPAVSVWHDDATVNGLRYPTRHLIPDWADNSDDLLDALTDEQRDHMRAVHETAHAIVALAAGGYVHRAVTRRTADLRATADRLTGGHQVGGHVATCNVADGRDFVTFLGAGERAEDRWLRETGLWTPTVAVGVEYGAYTDRREVLDRNPGLGFEGGHNDFLIVHELADQAVAEHWAAITAVAGVLAARLCLTGDEIADLAGLPNGTHSNTCTERTEVR